MVWDNVARNQNRNKDYNLSPQLIYALLFLNHQHQSPHEFEKPKE